MDYVQERKRQIDAMKGKRIREAFPEKAFNDDPDREPTDEEAALILEALGVPRSEVSITSSGGVWIRSGSGLRYYKSVEAIASKVRARGAFGTKVYSAGDKTTAIYDPKTGKPLVFQTGSKQSQMMEAKAVTDSREWRSSHGIPDDVDINFTE